MWDRKSLHWFIQSCIPDSFSRNLTDILAGNQGVECSGKGRFHAEAFVLHSYMYSARFTGEAGKTTFCPHHLREFSHRCLWLDGEEDERPHSLEVSGAQGSAV